MERGRAGEGEECRFQLVILAGIDSYMDYFCQLVATRSTRSCQKVETSSFPL